MQRAHKRALIHWSQYLGMRGLAGLVHSFPVNQNLRSAAAFGSLYIRCSRTRRERAEMNISLSFPEWPVERVRHVAERSVQHMFQIFTVDSMVTTRVITKSSWHRYIRIHPSIGRVMDRLIRGEPMILLTGHCGNWEVIGHFLALMGYPVLALARPLDNPLINRWLLGVREAAGTRILTKWGATPVLQETLEAGGRIAFIADQNAGDTGMFVPFFGRLASSYKSIALLALRYNVPIVAGCARRLNDRLEFELSSTDIIEPDDWADQPDPIYYITARFNRAIEQMIREAPDQYLWVHRRWKSRPRHEKEGKPLPPKLRAKIEALPWITEHDIERIANYLPVEGIEKPAGHRQPIEQVGGFDL
jgi:Kdo2-lipid IVA lauroyltransferase/acyltransferase